MRKMKKALVEIPPPPPPPFQMGGDGARARLKHQALLQDYEDLVKETKSKRETVQARKKQKLKLMAEVRFLRRKYKSLLKNSSQNTSYTPRMQSYCNPPPMEKCSWRSLPPKFEVQSQKLDSGKKQQQPVKERNFREKESAQPTSRPFVLDLNQASLPNDEEEEEELQVGWEPAKTEKPAKRHNPLEADPVSSDLRLSLCRDTGNGTSRAGKRKISWQDPVALRV